MRMPKVDGCHECRNSTLYACYTAQGDCTVFRVNSNVSLRLLKQGA